MGGWRDWRNWLWPDTPVSRDEWSVLILLGTAFLICRYDHALLNLAIPDIQRDFDLAESEIGSFVALARLGAVAAIPLAFLADRHGRRRLLFVTILGFTACSLATAFAPNWQTFALLQFMARAFTAADEILSVVVVLEELAARRRGWAVGLLAAMGALGEGLAAAIYPLSQFLPGEWRALYVLAAAPLLAATYFRRRLNETPHFRSVENNAGLGMASLVAAIRNRPGRFAALLAVTAAYNFPLSAVFSFMPKFLREVHGFGVSDVSVFFIATGLFALAGNLVGGSLADHIGRRLGFCLFAVLGTVAFGGFYNAPMMTLPVFWSFGLFSYLACHTIFLAIAGEAFPTVSRAAISAIALAAGSLTGAIGLVIESSLFPFLGSHRAVINLMLPALIVSAVVSMLLLPETRATNLEDVVTDRKTG